MPSYKCAKCTYQTQWNFALFHHKTRHRESQSQSPLIDCAVKLENHKCGKCKFETSSEQILTMHSELDHDTRSQLEQGNAAGLEFVKVENPIRCLNYDLAMPSSSLAATDECQSKPAKQRTVRHPVSYACDQCERVYKLKKHLKRHLKEAHAIEAKYHECTECSFKTTRKHVLKRHVINIHTDLCNIKWLHCFQCPYKAKDRQRLTQHIRYNHDNPRRFQCTQCPFGTNAQYKLMEHTVLEHVARGKYGDNKWFRCDECPYITKQEDDFKRHVLQHAYSKEIEWYDCNHCLYKFKRMGDLKKHIVTKHELCAKVPVKKFKVVSVRVVSRNK